MAGTSVKDDLISRMDELSPELQRRVLEFARSLSPKGVKGVALLKFGGSIPADDLLRMAKAIEDACEKVDAGEW